MVDMTSRENAPLSYCHPDTSCLILIWRTSADYSRQTGTSGIWTGKTSAFSDVVMNSESIALLNKISTVEKYESV